MIKPLATINRIIEMVKAIPTTDPKQVAAILVDLAVIQQQIHGLAKRTLGDVISEMSEERHFAGWLSGIEYDLWHELQNNPDSDDGDLRYLRELSTLLGGWVRWNDETYVADFVPLPEWQALYAAWVERKER